MLWDFGSNWQGGGRDWCTSIRTHSESPRVEVSFAHNGQLRLTFALFRWTFIIAAIGSAVAILVTYFFVPDMTGVDLADEDLRFMEYLERYGWNGVVGEDMDTNFIGRNPPTGGGLGSVTRSTSATAAAAEGCSRSPRAG